MTSWEWSAAGTSVREEFLNQEGTEGHGELWSFLLTLALEWGGVTPSNTQILAIMSNQKEDS